MLKEFTGDICSAHPCRNCDYVSKPQCVWLKWAPEPKPWRLRSEADHCHLVDKLSPCLDYVCERKKFAGYFLCEMWRDSPGTSTYLAKDVFHCHMRSCDHYQCTYRFQNVAWFQSFRTEVCRSTLPRRRSSSALVGSHLCSCQRVIGSKPQA